MKRLALPVGTFVVLLALLVAAAPALAAGPTVTTKPATDVTTTTAVLNATVNPGGDYVLECYFQYGTSTSYGSMSGCSPSLAGTSGTSDVNTGTEITGLTPGTTYDFQVVVFATDPSSPEITGANVTFTTLPSSSATKPTATATSATNVTGTTATLNGTVNPGGAALTQCQFTYGMDPTLTLGTTTVPCSSTPSGTTAQPVSANIGGLSTGTTYYYEVSATNSVGTGTSSTSNFTTGSTAATPPTATTNAATNVTGNAATLNGTVNPEGVAVNSCTFDYGTTTSYGKTAACSTTPSPSGGNQSVSANVTGLTGGTTYHFKVVITTSAGTGSGSDQSFTTSPIGSASTGPATSITATSATFNGTVNPEGQTVQSCAFYYGTGTGYQKDIPCSPSSISGSNPVTVTANATGLSPSTSYHYLVVLTTVNGNAFGNIVDFTTLTEPTGQTLPATLVSSDGATLNATVNPQGAKVIACEFQYGVSNLGAGPTPSSLTVPCAPKPSGSSNVSVSATLAGLASSTRYYYRILMETQAGDLIGSTVSFVTSRAAVVKPPGVRITRSTISVRHRSATFAFKATGAQAGGYQCALVKVTHGKAGAAHYSSCRSPKTYRRLAVGSYEFLVRARNAGGAGPAKSHRFTI